MKRMINFAKRNIIEILRDPISYIFGLGFPIVMLILFVIINQYTNGNTPMFESKALIPGIVMFSFTFIMLLMALLVSKDRSSSFLRRLYTSPMKTHEFIIGYGIVGIILGFMQEFIAIFTGFIISLIMQEVYFSFVKALLLFVSQIPILCFFVSLGILFGSLLNDKAAPGMSSVVISAANLLGGCFMPIETMGGFEKFCCALPFYPSLYIGRVVTGAVNAFGNVYTFDQTAKLGLISIFAFTIVSFLLSIFVFYHQAKDN